MIDHLSFFWYLIFHQWKSDYPWYVQHRDDSLFLMGKRVPNAKVVKLLGDGANGLVFQIVNEKLNRHEALKLWLRLRKGDPRNKSIQAIEEARKQAAAAGADVVPIYAVEEIRGVVLARMEFVSGQNLKMHLKEHPATRLEMLVRYVKLMQRTTKPGLYHGDPHHGNVLVYWEDSDKYNKYWDLKLCDFGTSHFEDDPMAGRTRHWQKLRENTKRLVGKLPNYQFYWQAFEQSEALAETWLSSPKPASTNLTAEEIEELEITLRFGPYRDLIKDLTQ